MLTFTKNTHKNTPTPHRNINYSAIRAGLSNAGVCPHTANQIAGFARLQLTNQRIFTQQAYPQNQVALSRTFKRFSIAVSKSSKKTD
jgi:hypothetical protein